MTSEQNAPPRKRSTKTGSSLRQKAEAALRDKIGRLEEIAPPSPENWPIVLHELRVHQIELEMQNEELRRVHAEAETARDRYIELFDFAPVGYLTLRQPGMILEANLTVALMLGVQRRQLIKSPLSHFVFPEDQDAYYLYLKALFKPEAHGTLEVRLVRRDGSHFYARLDALTRNGEDIIQLAISDVTDRKEAEERLRKEALLSEGLAQSVISLSSSLELEHVLDTILEQLHRSVPYTIAAITLIENDVVRVVRHTSLEAHPEAARSIGLDYPLSNSSMLKKISSSQQPIYVEDMAKSPDWSHIPGTEWIRSYIAAPLNVSGQFKGTIHLTSDQPNAFNQETLERLMAFAAPAALAVQNARLYTTEMRARQVAESISAMSLALTQITDLDVFLRTILEYLPKLASFDGAYIVTLDEEANLKLRVMAGYVNEIDPKRRNGSSFQPWEIPYIQEVITTKKSLLIRDTREYPGWETLVTRSDMRSWMGIPILLGDKVLGIVGMVHAIPESFREEQLHLLESIAAQISVVIQNAWLFEQVRAGQERFQSLSRRLVEVQESERRYIARELHDETSQALTAILFGLRSIEQEIGLPDEVRTHLAEVKQLADGVMESLHRLAVNLRPASLDHLGLEPALEQLVKEVAERYQLNIRYKSELHLDEGRLPDHMETALYRIIQEALTNTARHAHARNVDVILKSLEGKVLAMVEDDGIGFDPTEMRESDKLGLVGMQERAKTMGGGLQIESRPGGGTTIVVEVSYDDTEVTR